MNGLHHASTCPFTHINQGIVHTNGTGKTHLTTALGVSACRRGVPTRFVNGCGLVNELIEAQNAKALTRLIQRYAKYGLLELNELGNIYNQPWICRLDSGFLRARH
jgi:DNA replication protein DnaC